MSETLNIPNELFEHENINIVKITGPIGNICPLKNELTRLNRQLDRIILDFEINQNAQESYKHFQSFKQRLDEFITENGSIKYSSDSELLTAICRKANENEYLKQIQFAHQDNIKNSPTKVQFDQSPVKNAKKSKVLAMAQNEIPRFQIPEELQSVQELFQKAQYYFQEQIIDKAHNMQQIITKIMSRYEVDARYSEFVMAFREKAHATLAEIEDEYSFCIHNVNQLEEAENWPVERQEEGIMIKYKQNKEIQTISIYLEAVVEVSYLVIIAIINEQQHLGEYIPFFESAAMLRQINQARKVCYLRLKMPLISDREVYYYGAVFDRLDQNGSIVFVSRSVQDEKGFKEKYAFSMPEATSLVRLDIIYCVWQIEILEENRCRIRLITNSNLRFGSLHTSLMNLCQRKYSYYIMTKLIDKARNFQGSVWEKAIQENPEFYQWIQNKVQKYFSQQRQQLQ